MTHPPLFFPEPCLQSGVEAYREIPLTQGLVAIVDERDWEHLMQWKWYARRSDLRFYAGRSFPKSLMDVKKDRILHMHRYILDMHKVSYGIVDHVNRNGLDNRLCNLRSATHLLNRANAALSRNNTSGYKGVSFHSRINKWQAKIRVNQKNTVKHLGTFNTPQEAAIAYNKAALELYGDYAWLNPIEEEQP